MIARLALRSLLMHPIRTAVLAGGFGLGVAVMANLLGVAEVGAASRPSRPRSSAAATLSSPAPPAG